MDTIDANVANLAARQRGVIARDQLIDLGLSESQMRRRVAQHRLHPLTPQVYAVGHLGLGRRGLANAALLVVGTQRAAISHVSAARAWGLVSSRTDGPVHVSVTDRRKLELPAGAQLHRPRSLTPDEIVWHRGLPLTTPERTIRDLLPTSTVIEVTRMLEQAVTTLGRSPDDLHAWGRTLSSVRHRARLDEALDHVVGPAVLRSELERRFRDLCQETGLLLPETNIRLGRWEVDALWRMHRLVVELDSYRFHGGRWQFTQDRRKALDLAERGYEVVRLTWYQVKHERPAVARALARILERRAAHGVAN